MDKYKERTTKLATDLFYDMLLLYFLRSSPVPTNKCIMKSTQTTRYRHAHLTNHLRDQRCTFPSKPSPFCLSCPAEEKDKRGNGGPAVNSKPSQHNQSYPVLIGDPWPVRESNRGEGTELWSASKQMIRERCPRTADNDNLGAYTIRALPAAHALLTLVLG